MLSDVDGAGPMQPQMIPFLIRTRYSRAPVSTWHRRAVTLKTDCTRSGSSSLSDHLGTVMREAFFFGHQCQLHFIPQLSLQSKSRAIGAPRSFRSIVCLLITSSVMAFAIADGVPLI